MTSPVRWLARAVPGSRRTRISVSLIRLHTTSAVRVQRGRAFKVPKPSSKACR